MTIFYYWFIAVIFVTFAAEKKTRTHAHTHARALLSSKTNERFLVLISGIRNARQCDGGSPVFDKIIQWKLPFIAVNLRFFLGLRIGQTYARVFVGNTKRVHVIKNNAVKSEQERWTNERRESGLLECIGRDQGPRLNFGRLHYKTFNNKICYKQLLSLFYYTRYEYTGSSAHVSKSCLQIVRVNWV